MKTPSQKSPSQTTKGTQQAAGITSRTSTQRSASADTTARAAKKTNEWNAKGTAQTASANSITFGTFRFDNNTHMLYVDAQTPKAHFKCTITESALRDCFHAGNGGYEACFKRYEQQIGRAIHSKLQAGQWRVPQQEIRLETQDLKKFSDQTKG